VHYVADLITLSFFEILLIKADRSLSGDPGKVLAIVSKGDVGLYTRMVSGRLVLQMDDVENVPPEVVVLGDVRVEPTKLLLFELEPALVTNVTEIVLVVIFALLLFSHGGKRVYNNTEENIQQDNFNQDVEKEIEPKLEAVLLLLVFVMDRLCVMANSSIQTDPFI